MKISFITTVYNEESTIVSFLDSLFHQSQLPDEIIIVDANSIDSTSLLIKNYFEKNKINSKTILIEKKGNRSIGRNTAIEIATGEIIAVSDVGCILDKDWLKNITFPFNKNNMDVVAGYYYPLTNSIFEKALATYTCVMSDRVDKNNFLPSSRSVAFTKKSWGAVKGYPENLDTCEDLVFAKKLQQAHMMFIFREDAFVLWPQRKNIVEAAKQFYGYAKGDGFARYFRKSTPYLYIRYSLGVILLYVGVMLHLSFLLHLVVLLILFYCLWATKKNYRYVNTWRAFFYLPLLQMTADITVIVGTTMGLLQSVL